MDKQNELKALRERCRVHNDKVKAEKARKQRQIADNKKQKEINVMKSSTYQIVSLEYFILIRLKTQPN